MLKWDLMKSKLLRKADGEIRIINNIGAVSLLLLFILNLLNQIHLNRNVFERIEYTAPYLVGAILLYFLNWKYIISIVLLAVGTYTLFNTSDPADLSSVLFFCLSHILIRKHLYSVFILVLTIVSLSIRSINLGDSIPQAIIIILGFFALYALFYFIVTTAKKDSIAINLKTLTKEENTLLRLMAGGMTQIEAGYELGYNKYTTNNIVKRIRKKTKTNSLYTIFYLLGSKKMPQVDAKSNT